MSVPKESLRVYLVGHHDGKLTASLLARSWAEFAPSAFGASEAEVLDDLEQLIADMLARDPAALDPFMWDESLSVRTVRVEIQPQAVVDKRWVIGKQPIPLRLTFAWSRLAKGGYRVILPRFGWRFVLEDLDIAATVLRQAVSSALLGRDASTLFDFRVLGPERVIAWSPSVLGRRRRDRGAAMSWSAFPALHAVAEELVERSRRKRSRLVEPPDLRAHAHLWARETPASLLLVGGPGVGKTTWVETLAREFSRRRSGAGSRSAPKIWATSAERIIAGMMYLGQWEQRCLDIVHELSHEGDYLYAGQLPPLLDTRSARSSIADFFLPAMEAGDVSLIAECHPREYELLKTKHPRLLAAFSIIKLDETPTAAMPGLLRAYQARVNPRLELQPEALRRLVQHLELFRRDTCFPGKGFRFLDWLNQEHGLDLATSLASELASELASGRAEDPRSTSPGVDFDRPPSPSLDTTDPTAAAQPLGPTLAATKVLRAPDASAAFSRHTGLPLELISEEAVAGPEHIAARLRVGVIGQDQACATAARVLARFKAGLDDPERPVGSLFFVGPTGVGKTELAKQLARYMFGAADRMIRLDMSEYMLPGAAQRLLAVGPGVSSLAEKVRQQPLSLILLDEIEKAHPEVFDLLLAVLGEGRMTDAGGSLIDFRMTLIVMTSNLGVSQRGPAGFGVPSEDERARSFDAAVRRHFRPEFFNRIDSLVPFRNLAPADIRRIVDLELAKLGGRTGLTRRNLGLEVSAQACTTLADWGWHPTRGARPLKRVLEEQLMAPLAVLLARSPKLRDRVIRVLAHGEGGEVEKDALVVVLPRERPATAR
ncbi:ATP-dependent Clp protease ATP-binding subunit [Pseudenhygromyxa sp. WMMC2535]|uniref:AAA family ATPase n=1 Tax=Pseudenhygromyxa sp. WMMC2535 TaxID=2712867 RepID=UPI0015572C6B|nr:AAA family ATPase [Pseudenhygromyxa sp. WMMC2535]NVB42886.1 ATP-dependent Clp protease ATP-binding subunit [Pseudenhygromyxa sp. WMMC2535]